MSGESQTGVFLDTNVLVYAYDRSAGQKHSIAAQVVETCWVEENGCLCIQVLQEFFVTVTRKISAPLDLPTARQIVADLAHWRLQAPDVAHLLDAIDLQQTYQLSFWDAMVVQSAVSLGCAQLLSEDLSHGQIFGEVKIVNPFKGLN